MQTPSGPLRVLLTGLAVIAVLTVALTVALTAHVLFQSYDRGQDYRKAQNATKIARERVQQQTYARCVRSS